MFHASDWFCAFKNMDCFLGCFCIVIEHLVRFYDHDLTLEHFVRLYDHDLTREYLQDSSIFMRTGTVGLALIRGVCYLATVSNADHNFSDSNQYFGS